MTTGVFLTILFTCLFFAFSIAVSAGVTQKQLTTRAKGLLQAHRLNVIKVALPQPTRKIDGMYTFVAFYTSAGGVKQQRHFCVPKTFDRIFWLEDEVETTIPTRLWATEQPLSSKEQIISDLSAENAALKRQIEQMKLKD